MKSNEQRKEILNHTSKYVKNKCFQRGHHYDLSTGNVIIFNEYALGKKHGNFHDKSYQAIKNCNSWSNRLNKNHTHKSVPSGSKELDSCNSSDALLMNIFCYPKISDWNGIRQLFRGDTLTNIEFGFNPKIPKSSGFDETEIDLVCDSFFAESKLTETDFTTKDKKVVESYLEFKNVFDETKLLQNKDEYCNYQLIRNILALKVMPNKHFYLICDQRRTDLIKSFFDTVICIKDIDYRMRCHIVFWQEIADKSGQDLKVFLKEKYGF